MATLSIAEILKKTCELKSKEEKVEWLRNNNSTALRNILILTYDKNHKLKLPATRPPYTKSEFPDSHGMLYREARKLKYFVEGMENSTLPQVKLEQMFILMLESVDKDDSEVLVNMIERKPLKGLTAAVINEAFGEIIKPQTKSKKDGKA